MSVKEGGVTEIINEKIPEKGTTDRTLYIKDKYNLSNQACHELAMVNPTLPHSCATYIKNSERAKL